MFLIMFYFFIESSKTFFFFFFFKQKTAYEIQVRLEFRRVLFRSGFIAWIQEPGYGLADMAWLLVRQIGIGLAVGAAVGAVTIAALRRARLDTGGLYPVATLAAAALAFGGADTLH